MAEKVAKTGVRREPNYLYFIDHDGDVARVEMARGAAKGGVPEKVARVGIEKERGYLYFLDQDGDVARARMRT